MIPRDMTSHTPPHRLFLSAVATDPVPQLVETGKETTMSCSSITTPVTVASMEWYNAAGVVYTDSSPVAVQENG